MKKVKTPQIIQDEKLLKNLGLSFLCSSLLFLAILQASVKLSFETWKKSILELDSKVLTVDLLEKLRSVLPPVDTMNKLKEADKEVYDEMVEGEKVSFLF